MQILRCKFIDVANGNQSLLTRTIFSIKIKFTRRHLFKIVELLKVHSQNGLNSCIMLDFGNRAFLSVNKSDFPVFYIPFMFMFADKPSGSRRIAKDK